MREKDKELKSLREKCDLLEHQLQVYKDDFQNERKDREKMHQRFAELENEHQKMKDVGILYMNTDLTLVCYIE